MKLHATLPFSPSTSKNGTSSCLRRTQLAKTSAIAPEANRTVTAAASSTSTLNRLPSASDRSGNIVAVSQKTRSMGPSI